MTLTAAPGWPPRLAVLFVVAGCRVPHGIARSDASPTAPELPAAAEPEAVGELRLFMALAPGQQRVQRGFSGLRVFVKVEELSTGAIVFDAQFPFTGAMFTLPKGEYRLTSWDVIVSDDNARVEGRLPACETTVEVDPDERVDLVRLDSIDGCDFERASRTPRVALLRAPTGESPNPWWWIRVWVGTNRHPSLEVALPPRLSAVYFDFQIPPRFSNRGYRISASSAWTGTSHRICQADFTSCKEFLDAPHCEVSFLLDRASGAGTEPEQTFTLRTNSASASPQGSPCEIVGP